MQVHVFMIQLINCCVGKLWIHINRAVWAAWANAALCGDSTLDFTPSKPLSPSLGDETNLLLSNMMLWESVTSACDVIRFLLLFARKLFARHPMLLVYDIQYTFEFMTVYTLPHIWVYDTFAMVQVITSQYLICVRTISSSFVWVSVCASVCASVWYWYC